jgi:hypothetical protein
MESKDIPAAFFLIRYEDMKEDIFKETRRVLDYLGLSEIDNQIVQKAIEYSSFENMHRMESQATLQSHRLKPGDSNDPESYKTRRGNVGGYKDYLRAEDITYLNWKINNNLNISYGYNGND